MATRSFPITWSFSLTWKFIYEESTIPTRFVCTPLTAVSLFCALRWRGGGGERVETFFSCGNNCFYSLSTHPLVRGTARPQTQQSLISFLHSHSLCCHATPLAIARGHKKNSWLQTHRTWVKKGIWTIVFVGLSLVTYWNSLCPRLEKWKLCR